MPVTRLVVLIHVHIACAIKATRMLTNAQRDGRPVGEPVFALPNTAA